MNTGSGKVLKLFQIRWKSKQKPSDKWKTHSLFSQDYSQTRQTGEKTEFSGSSSVVRPPPGCCRIRACGWSLSYSGGASGFRVFRVLSLFSGMSAFVPPTAADAAAAVAFGAQADFHEIQEACFIAERGCKVVDLRRVVVGPELATLAGMKSMTAMSFALYPLLLAHPQASERPELADLAAQARDSGGDGATQTQAAARLMLAAVIEFLCKREGHGGLRHVPGKFLFLPSAFPSGPPAPASALSPAGPTDPAPTPGATTTSDSGGSRKRGAEDLTADMDSFSPAEEGGGKRPAAKAAGGDKGGDEASALFEMSSEKKVSSVGRRFHRRPVGVGR